MHEVESSIDLLELQLVGDHRIDLDQAVHIPVDDLRHVGAAAGAAEGCASPDAPRHQLEGPCRNLLAGARHANDDGFAPALVAGLEGCAHDLDVANAFESVVGAAAGQL